MSKDILEKGAIVQRDQETVAVAPHIAGGIIDPAGLRKIADVAEKYLRKGSKVYLEGALQTRKWTDQSGQDKYTTEVVLGRFKSTLTMLDSKSSGSGGYDSANSYNNNNNNNSGYNNNNSFGGSPDNVNSAPSVPDLDDEIPF